MRNGVLVVLVVGGLLLVGLAAAATTNTAVGDFHTTNSDFNAADTLENVSVANGNVTYATGEYNVVEDSGDGTAEAEHFLAGETSDGNVGNSQYKIKPDFSADITELVVDIESVNNGGLNDDVAIRIASGNPSTNSRTAGTKVKDWSAPGSTGAATITLTTQYSVTAGENYTVTFDTGTIVSNGDAENITISTDDNSGLTGWSGLNVSTSDAGGNITARSAVPDADRAIYVSDNLSVTDPTTAWTNLSELDNASATVTWQYHDGSSWSDAATNTYTTAGNKTVSLSQSADTWRVNVTWQNQSGNGFPIGVLSDDGLQFTNHHPTVDNDSASPNGSTTQSTVTLSIDVNDSEFSTAQGDSVTVEFFVDGSSVGTDTLTSNGTATTQYTQTDAGNETWWAWANDSYGGTTRSRNFTLETPSELEIRNEENHTQLIDNATVELIFYFDNEPVVIEEKNTSDGTINMTGLPANRPFVVSARADGWYTRRVYLESLFDQQTIYLLNTSVQATQTTFTLRDFTGRFPAETSVLKVQRAINESWQTVEGDFFGGVNEMEAQLRFNIRHRLIVLNTNTGERKTYNALFSATSGEKVVTITTGDIRVSELGVAVSISPNGGRVPASNQTFSADFQNASKSFDQYSLRVRVNDSGQYTYFGNRSGTQPGGETLSVRANLSQNATETVEVNVTYVVDGQTYTRWRNYTVSTQYTRSGLVDLLALVPTRLSSGGDGITTFLGFFVSFSLAIAARKQLVLGTEATGLVLLLGLGGFTLLAWFPAPYLFVAGMAWTVAAGVRRGV